MDIIKEYIQLLITEYEFDEDTLLKLWTDAHPEEEEKIPPKKVSFACDTPEVIQPKINEAELKKLNKAKLQELCKEKNLSPTGTKQVLIDRILNPTPVVQTQTKKKTNSKKQVKIADVLKKLAHNRNIINIRRNTFGHYHHADTEFVFNEAHKVIGKQNPSGVIDPLTEEDILTCKELGFEYDIIPSLTVEKIHDEYKNNE